MQRIWPILLITFSLFCGVTAQERTDSMSALVDDGGPLTVSIVTCAPGPDVYELCGHAALRIRNEKMDSVWNYGIFDFTSPNFLYRFCKGQTDYLVCGYNFERFMPTYIRRGSRVTEQILNLTQEEAQNLRQHLQIEILPENRVYRYNYVLDNCATRPWKRVKESVTREIEMPDTLYFSTFREEMKSFHKNYPWYQFGIDLALGSGIDRHLQGEEDTFTPLVLADKIAMATIGNSPLVAKTNVIFPGYVDATLSPTPWILTPMAAGVLMLMLSIASFIAARYQNSYWRWWISIYFIMAGLAGCVLTFLVFCSEHEATSPNWLLLWLNPLQLIPGIGVWFWSWKRPVAIMAICNITIITIMIFIVILQYISAALSNAGFLIQEVNPAAIPMIFSAIPLSMIVLYNLKIKIRDK